MATKQEILTKNGVYYEDLISSSTMGGIEAAMDEYVNKVKAELIEWCEKQIKEYDAASENLTSELTNYYLGKATGINDVKLFLTANKKV